MPLPSPLSARNASLMTVVTVKTLFQPLLYSNCWSWTVLLMRVKNTNYRHHCHQRFTYNDLRVTVSLFSPSPTVTNRHRFFLLTPHARRCSVHSVAHLADWTRPRQQGSDALYRQAPHSRELSAANRFRPARRSKLCCVGLRCGGWRCFVTST